MKLLYQYSENIYNKIRFEIGFSGVRWVNTRYRIVDRLGEWRRAVKEGRMDEKRGK